MKEIGKTVKLQKKLIDEIDLIIEKHPELFYRNRTDFIADALRKHIQNILGGSP